MIQQKNSPAVQQPSVSSTTIAAASHPLDLVPQIALMRADQLRKEQARPQRRLFLVGISGSGKSYSVMTTAPKPIALEYDNQMDHPDIRSHVYAIYSLGNPVWCEQNMKGRLGPQGLLQILRNDFKKLDTSYTVVVDNMTTLGDIAEDVLWAAVPKGKSGEKDGYAFWDQWADYWCEVCTAISQLPCNAVLIAHEKETRDEETGRLLNYGWLFGGKKFTPRFPQFFTDVARQWRETKITGTGPNATAKEEYYWQIRPTKEFPYAKTRCSTAQLHIKASWDELIK